MAKKEGKKTCPCLPVTPFLPNGFSGQNKARELEYLSKCPSRVFIAVEFSVTSDTIKAYPVSK